MLIFWYIDRHGHKNGTVSEYKRDRMAEQNYATTIGHCDIADFDGHLLSSEWVN